MSNFGANFRKARETAGLPLERIAEDTRISTRFLLAIEREEFHLLPGGIFNRGFIRAYAERVGIDADGALADYDALSATVEEPLEVLRNAERASTRRTERNFYPIAAAVLVLLIGGYYFVRRQSTSARNPSPPAVAAKVATASEVTPRQEEPQEEPVVQPVSAPYIPPPVPIPVELANGPAGAQEETLTPTAPAAERAEPARPTPELAAARASAPPAAGPNTGTAANPGAIPTLYAAPNTPTGRSALTPLTSATATSTSTASVLVLDVAIKDVTWIEISADGAIVVADNLPSGATRRVSAERSLVITVGNAAGASLRINGRDLGSLGQNGRVRQFRITPENVDRIGG